MRRAKGRRVAIGPSLRRATRLLGRSSALAVVLLVALTGLASADEPVTVTASVDREVTSVGDRIALTVTVVRPSSILVSEPSATSFGGDIEAVDGAPPQHTPNGDGTTTSVFHYVIAAFRTGDQVLAPISVTYTNVDGTTAVATSNPVTFTIRSVIPSGQNPSDIRDLKPQLSLASGTPSIVYRPIVAGFVALDIGLLVIILMFRRRSTGRRRVAAPLPEASGPWIGELDALATEGLVEKGDYKAFYRRVALIVRSFLSERYGIPARALTRSELEVRMAAAGFDTWQARLVNGLLQEADRVVYAEYAPARERAEGALGLAYQVVELGLPQQQEPALVGA